MPEKSHPKIAIVHDWLVTYAGSERVFEQMLKVFPDADLFSLIDILPEKERAFLRSRQVKTSLLQSFPFKKTLYRHYLPFMPFAVEQLNLARYDIVISSCHAVSKGVITSPQQLHICYIHTPIRYAWDMQEDYLRAAAYPRFKEMVTRAALHYIRLWDLAASSRPDILLANSAFIASRIRKTYRREAQILHPPVDTDFFSLQEQKQDYYLTASRLVPYKRVDLVVKAFEAMPHKTLIVIGDGPESKKLRHIPANIKWLGYQDAENLKKYMQNARAFLIAAQEDFGIAPLEAQACGTPVIAFREGGLGETIQGLDEPAPTGVFFDTQNAEAIVEAVQLFEKRSGEIHPAACRVNAERFSVHFFQRNFKELVNKEWERFKARSM